MKKSLIIVPALLVIFNILYSGTYKPVIHHNYPFRVTDCEKCDLKKLKLVHDHLEKLSLDMVSDFLCTFDAKCKDDHDYSEASNDLLFLVMSKAPELFLKALEQDPVDKKLLLEEVRSPAHDDDLQQVYSHVKNAKGNEEFKKLFLDAISVAQEKSGRKITK